MTRSLGTLAGCAAALAFTLAACGGGSSSPSGSGGNGVQSIAVTAATPLRAGQTTQASAVATFSGGRTEAITTGWRTDAPSVATVTDAGLITGMANGNAVISVTSGARTAQQTVRVVPDYDGTWSGTYRITTCAESGYFASEGFCAATSNSAVPVRFSISQNGLSASTSFALGQLGFPSAVSPIDTSGVLAIGDTVFSEAVTITARWMLQQGTAGVLTGSVHQRWEVPNRSGEGVLDGEIISVSRTTPPPAGIAAKSRFVLSLREIIRGAGFPARP